MASITIELSEYDRQALAEMLKDDRDMRLRWCDGLHATSSERKHYEYQIALLTNVVNQMHAQT